MFKIVWLNLVHKNIEEPWLNGIKIHVELHRSLGVRRSSPLYRRKILMSSVSRIENWFNGNPLSENAIHGEDTYFKVDDEETTFQFQRR